MRRGGLVKALTLQQPWATLIALGLKSVETRRWHPRENPGKIVICSSKKPITGPAHERLLGTQPFAECLAGHETPRSAMLAVATLDRCERTEMLHLPEVPWPEVAFGDYSPGRWAWFLTDVTALPEPVPLTPLRKGERDFRLSLWDLREPDEKALRAALP